MSNPDFKNFLQQHKQRIDQLLNRQLSIITLGAHKELAAAMRHVVLSGGKRLRSLLVYLVGQAYGAKNKLLDLPACAIEMIHSFSLVHDDLPAMDDDSLRRGQPTCHLAFDEATAILAGDALAVAAFGILSGDKNLAAEKRSAMCVVLAEAAGAQGMAGGQYLDLHAPAKITRNKLEAMYTLKTGKLISAAVKLGALAAGVNNQRELKLLAEFACNVGLAFQIQDDLLNIEGDANKLGKNIGTDQVQNKTTYPVLLGKLTAKTKIKELWHKSQQILQQLGIENNRLTEFTRGIMQRNF